MDDTERHRKEDAKWREFQDRQINMIKEMLYQAYSLGTDNAKAEARLKDAEARACHCGCPACRNDGPVCSYSDLEARLAAAEKERDYYKKTGCEWAGVCPHRTSGLNRREKLEARIAELEAENKRVDALLRRLGRIK